MSYRALNNDLKGVYKGSIIGFGALIITNTIFWRLLIIIIL